MSGQPQALSKPDRDQLADAARDDHGNRRARILERRRPDDLVRFAEAAWRHRRRNAWGVHCNVSPEGRWFSSGGDGASQTRAVEVQPAAGR